MGRRRALQLNVRIRPDVAVAFDRAIGDLPWTKVFIVERLLESFVQLDRTQRERLLMVGRADAPEFLDHAWRVLGEHVPADVTPAVFELLHRFTELAVDHRTGPVHALLDQHRSRDPDAYGASLFSKLQRTLTASKVQPATTKSEVVRLFIGLGATGWSPAEAVERLRAATTA